VEAVYEVEEQCHPNDGDTYNRQIQLSPSLVNLSTRSNTTFSPLRTLLKMVGSPSKCPKTLTGLAGRISSPRLAGVRPKKMQKALPAGQ
jgi:hypothetical protein